MRILLYSDLHISRTSSILPMLSNSMYTYRQKMIMDTGEWLAQIASNEKPDLIINLGDTFDQHTVTSYDIDVASKFFGCFKVNNYVANIPHLILVGNHEMINQNFNAIEILNNIEGITVIKDAISIPTNIFPNIQENKQLAFLPYCDYKQILKYPEGEFLFSHQDIQGSKVRGDFVLPDGIETQDLTRYKLVFNGHIHKSSIFNNVVNIGSVTTHSFSDDNESVPQAYIFNTETLNLETFKNKACPLFRKIEITDLQQLQNYITNLDDYYKYILNVVCPFEIKEQVKQYLNKQTDKVLNTRLNVKISKEQNNQTTNVNLQLQNLQSTNIDIHKTFLDFLNTVDLKYPLDIYKFVLNGVDKDDNRTELGN